MKGLQGVDSSFRKDGYTLGRGYISSTRLNLFHYLIKDALGYMINPTILNGVRGRASGTADNREIAIADLGTGTGIYLFDLLRCPELKDCKLWLHGFDISGDQFPHSTWLPSNITFSISDASRDPDEQFKGKFDVVNIRLFALVVADGDPTAIIRHAKSLLKPGGYIQWSEHGPWSKFDVLTADGSHHAVNMAKLINTTASSPKQQWVGELSSYLEEEGFVDTEQIIHYPRPEMQQAWTYGLLTTCEEVSWNSPDLGGMKQRRELLEEIYKESLDPCRAALIKQIMSVTTGRLPL